MPFLAHLTSFCSRSSRSRKVGRALIMLFSRGFGEYNHCKSRTVTMLPTYMSKANCLDSSTIL